MTEYYVYFQPKFRPIVDSQTTYQHQLFNKKKQPEQKLPFYLFLQYNSF